MVEELLGQLLKAFLVGGGICLIGQLLFDVLNLTPAHTMSILVISGSILSGLGIYPLLVDFAGFGAMLPISSFGNVLAEGARAGAAEGGFWGIFSGLLKQVSAGISAAVVFGFLAALFFKPKS
jgi:stage V sporulation protein AE